MIRNNDLLTKRVNINHPNVIKIIYFYQNQDKMHCTHSTYNHQIYIEQYQELLFTYLQRINKNRDRNTQHQCYCCPIVNGFFYLTEKYEFFNISQKMIYASSQSSSWKKKPQKAIVKVWLNQKLQKNIAQKTITEHQMCDQLIKLIKNMSTLGICCVPQMKHIPQIFHMQNLINYIYNAHNDVYKKQSQTRKRVISTISSINSQVPRFKQVAIRQTLTSKNNSFSNYFNENTTKNTPNVPRQLQKIQTTNFTPKKQYNEPIQSSNNKFKHFNYISKAYQQRKKLKVNFLYNNDNFSTPKPNHSQKLQNINTNMVESSQFQFNNIHQQPYFGVNQPKTQQISKKQQNLQATSQNTNTRLQKTQHISISIKMEGNSNTLQIQDNTILSDSQLKLKLQQLVEEQFNGNKAQIQNIAMLKNQPQFQNHFIIEQQNQYHSNDQKDNQQVQIMISHLDHQQQRSQHHQQQQFLAKFNEIKKIQPKQHANKHTQQRDKHTVSVGNVLMLPQQIKQTQSIISKFDEKSQKKSSQTSSKKYKNDFVPYFGKSKELSSPRSLKNNTNSFKSKLNDNDNELGSVRNNTTIDGKFSNYLKKFNKMIGSDGNKNMDKNESPKNNNQMISTKINNHNDKNKIVMKNEQYQHSIYNSLQADRDNIKDKSKSNYSIAHKKQIESLYNESVASQEEAMKLKLIQKIQNTQKIMRQNRKKLEKIELQKELQKQKLILKNQMESLLKNNLIFDESNSIKQKVKHKKATFAQLKAQAAKILQDLNF